MAHASAHTGKLFVVGDDKQAIYRFRGADMGVTQMVKDGGQLVALSLGENRRSQEPILNWVNAVFGERGLMGHIPGIQAGYSALTPNAGLQSEDTDAAVRLFGEPVDLAAGVDTIERGPAPDQHHRVLGSRRRGSEGL